MYNIIIVLINKEIEMNKYTIFTIMLPSPLFEFCSVKGSSS